MSQALNIIREKAKPIRLVIFDVDGILTTGRIIVGPDAEESKSFHVHDGLGMKLLQKTGVKVGIITARKSAAVAKRMQHLDIMHVYQGYEDKLLAYEHLKLELQLNDEQIAYVGDDLPDLPILRRVGLSITVANAIPLIQQYAYWVTQAKGGKGAAREVCDFIMQAQGTYQTAIKFYLER
jgi:3-deoxy-D-manno-octulosonate 8-phosphate phosphatase (KDO 8-P phosphatase)